MNHDVPKFVQDPDDPSVFVFGAFPTVANILVNVPGTVGHVDVIRRVDVGKLLRREPRPRSVDGGLTVMMRVRHMTYLLDGRHGRRILWTNYEVAKVEPNPYDPPYEPAP